MSIRTEVKEAGTALANIGLSFIDGDKEGATEYFELLFNLGKEGSDFAKIPQDERLKAIEHAFAFGLAEMAEKGIKYSDEV